MNFSDRDRDRDRDWDRDRDRDCDCERVSVYVDATQCVYVIRVFMCIHDTRKSILQLCMYIMIIIGSQRARTRISANVRHVPMV